MITGKGGRGGGVQPILTLPYRGGRGVKKSEKLPSVIYEWPLRIKDLRQPNILVSLPKIKVKHKKYSNDCWATYNSSKFDYRSLSLIEILL